MMMMKTMTNQNLVSQVGLLFVVIINVFIIISFLDILKYVRKDEKKAGKIKKKKTKKLPPTSR